MTRARSNGVHVFAMRRRLPRVVARRRAFDALAALVAATVTKKTLRKSRRDRGDRPRCGRRPIAPTRESPTRARDAERGDRRRGAPRRRPALPGVPDVQDARARPQARGQRARVVRVLGRRERVDGGAAGAGSRVRGTSGDVLGV